MVSEIPNHKFQTSSKFQFLMTNRISFGIWVMGNYLEIGACRQAGDLVLAYDYARWNFVPCPSSISE